MYRYLLLTFQVVVKGAIAADMRHHKNYHLIDHGENCGFSVSNRIFGGRDATLGQFPWLARIGYWDITPRGRKIDYSGAGSIISKLYILTAAHVYDPSANVIPVKVALGDYNTATDPDCQNGVCAPPVQIKDIQEAISHVNFTTTSDPCDIALLRLFDPIEFNDFVAPICLPVGALSSTLNLTNTIAEVAGWGTFNSGNQMSRILKTLSVRVWSFPDCKEEWKRSLDINLIYGQFCAGGKGGEDTCGGDSGGPLMKGVMEEGMARYYVIGIVSFGYTNCAQEGKPGVYTLVANFIDWIMDNMHV